METNLDFTWEIRGGHLMLVWPNQASTNAHRNYRLATPVEKTLIDMLKIFSEDAGRYRAESEMFKKRCQMRCWEDFSACINCGATERPDRCSGGPRCMFP